MAVERAFVETFERFGYQPIRTPIFESADLFERAVGEETDVASKEMYTFTDRGGRRLTLRPENTAAVVRAYLENGMHRWGGLVRLYYVGPMFRYDRPQAGRYRQFHQVGVEVLGGASPEVDVEVVDVVLSAFQRIGFVDLETRINSVGCRRCRPSFRRSLQEALRSIAGDLCEDCRVRMERNPLRVLDCKRCLPIKEKLPKVREHLCGECEEHFTRVEAGLQALGWNYQVDPYLVRGLDYYTKTTFEILHPGLGAQNALCGGGRYDNLVEECGGPPTPAVGFSAGLERIMSVLPERQDLRPPGPDFYVACCEASSATQALQVAKELRKVGTVSTDLTFRNLKKQIRGAEKARARFCVVVGKDYGERVLFKDMERRSQEEVERRDLVSYARSRKEGA